MDMQSEITEQSSQSTQSPTTLLSKKEQYILDNQMEILWLKRQIEQRKQDYESYATIKEDVEQLSDDQVEEQLQYYIQQVESLRVSMDIMAQFNLSKDRISTNLDDNHYALEAQYPRHDDLDALGDMQTQQVREYLMKRDKLVVEAMQLLDKVNGTQNQVANLHAQAIGKYQDNQQLWTNMERTKRNVEQQAETETPVQTQSLATQSQGRPAGSRASVASSKNTNEMASEKLHDVLNRLEVAKNVLMGLILESNIDWSSDVQWSRVMLLIGTEEDD